MSEVVKVKFKKNFISGNMDGVVIDSHIIKIDQSILSEYLEHLQEVTKDNPNTDLTGNKYFVTNVIVENA